MYELLKKYEKKLIQQGLCEPDAPLLGAMDDEMEWNRQGGEEAALLREIAEECSFSAMLFSPLREPLNSMVNLLCQNLPQGENHITPGDSETLTFLHSIPIVNSFNKEEIAAALKRRKGAIVKDRGIVTYGIIGPEQAFITFSSISFSCYVKFMEDYSLHIRGHLDQKFPTERIARDALREYGEHIYSIKEAPSFTGDFTSSEEVIESIVETGRLTVETGMVDSFFGNISVRYGDTIYISQTGSSLDELRGLIDPCPMDNSRSNAITSSSEFSAHKGIYSMWGHRTILHGHPRFSVIMSLLICPKNKYIKKCNCIDCDKLEFLKDIPIVPGEVGTGPTGIATTLPPEMGGRGAIVYGHGLFTVGEKNFSHAFQNLIKIEQEAFQSYIELSGITL